MKIIAGLLGGLMFAILGGLLVSIVFSASPEAGESWEGFSFLTLWIVGFIIAITAKRAAKSWRRLLICSAILSFLLPLAGVIYTGRFITTQVDLTAKYAGAEAVGAAIGGGLISGFLGFVGFFLGLVLLIIGLLVGRDQNVIYVERQSPDENR